MIIRWYYLRESLMWYSIYQTNQNVGGTTQEYSSEDLI
jgi:hypothetical protein